jgi:hypothetical protein
MNKSLYVGEVGILLVSSRLESQDGQRQQRELAHRLGDASGVIGEALPRHEREPAEPPARFTVFTTRCQPRGRRVVRLRRPANPRHTTGRSAVVAAEQYPASGGPGHCLKLPAGGLSGRAAGEPSTQPWHRPPTRPNGSTIQPVDACPLPQSAQRGGPARAANRRSMSPAGDRALRGPDI